MFANALTRLFSTVNSSGQPIKIFVGGLPWSVTQEALAEMVRSISPVEEIQLITARDTGRSRGFGFITVSNQNAANNLIAGLDGKEVEGRSLKAQIAEERDPSAPRPDRGGYADRGFSRGGYSDRGSSRGGYGSSRGGYSDRGSSRGGYNRGGSGESW